MISFDNIFTYNPQGEYFVADREPLFVFQANRKQLSVDSIFHIINKKFDNIISDKFTCSCVVCDRLIKVDEGYISIDNAITIHKKCNAAIDRIIHKKSIAKLHLKSGDILFSHHIYLIDKKILITASKGIFQKYTLNLDVLATDTSIFRELLLIKFDDITRDNICDNCDENARYTYINNGIVFCCCERCKYKHDIMKFKLIYIKYVCDQLLIVDVSNKIVNDIIDIYEQFMP